MIKSHLFSVQLYLQESYNNACFYCRGKVVEDENPPPTKKNSPASLGEWEKLQDTVLAYEMQNKFLNKEVLELNQLRTQANDREQKLFM